MKKFLLATVIVLILSVPLGVFAEDDVVFGSFWWEADNGLSLFASGGNGDCDVFGFEIITEKRTVQLPVIGADFSENYSVKITGISDGSYTLRGFACRGGVYFYSDALYVTVTNGEYSVKTQAELREAAKKALSEYVDKSLYRVEEQAQIDEIVARYSESIDNAASFEEYDSILESAYSELDVLRTKEWYEKNEAAKKALSEYVDKSLYRVEEQAQIDEIVARYSESIDNAASFEEYDSILESAYSELDVLRTKEWYEKNEAAKKALSEYVDKSLYREKEQAQIDEIVARYSESIDNAASFEEYDSILENAYSELDALHIKEWYDQNISANEEVLYYLSNANEWLTTSRFVGKERQITDIIKPVVQEVLEMGSKGEILISNDYIRSTYADDIAQAKKIYNEDMSETERSRFNERLVELDTETADFLKEFFS